MAHNPQAPQQGPQDHDPAGSTQMFQAFVNDGPPAQPGAPAAATSAGPRVGVIVGVVLAVVALVAVAWLALG